MTTSPRRTPGEAPAGAVPHPDPKLEPVAPDTLEQPGPDGPPIVLTTDPEAQTDDPLINPTNS